MDIYLPIAEVSVNWPTLVILGAVVGFVSGLFGIGGGFLMAPILVFLGIPPTVAVASQASHVVASSTSGVISYTSQKAVDYRIGGIMAGAWVSGRMAGRIPPKQQIRHGFVIMLVIAVLNLAANLLFKAHVSWALFPIAVFAFGWALMVPVSLSVSALGGWWPVPVWLLLAARELSWGAALLPPLSIGADGPEYSSSVLWYKPAVAPVARRSTLVPKPRRSTLPRIPRRDERRPNCCR